MSQLKNTIVVLIVIISQLVLSCGGISSPFPRVKAPADFIPCAPIGAPTVWSNQSSDNSGTFYIFSHLSDTTWKTVIVSSDNTNIPCDYASTVFNAHLIGYYNALQSACPTNLEFTYTQNCNELNLVSTSNNEALTLYIE